MDFTGLYQHDPHFALAALCMIIVFTDGTCPQWVSYYLEEEQDVLDEFERFNVIFLPAMLPFLHSSNPPAATFFLDHSLLNLPGFGVYVITMGKKIGGVMKYKLYGGSGTESDKGMPLRLSHYDSFDSYGHMWSKEMRKAYEDGYRVLGKSVVAWMPMPDLLHQARALVLLLESAISVSFGFLTPGCTALSHMRLWSNDRLGYTG